MSKIPIKSEQDLEAMRRTCQLTAAILDAVGEIIEPGINTEEINSFIHKMTLDNGAQPSTLNYKGFTRSCCTSVNDVVCHGIPSQYVILKEGDIINIDVTSYREGFHGDSSRMFLVGGEQACSKEALELVKITKQALFAGIEAVRPGAKVGDIGAAIHDFIKDTGKGYGIVREYTGHGVGREFHEPPQVVHIAKRGSGDLLKPGMTFTIEPMINIGTHKTVLSQIDGWTVRTADGSLSAQWEHTVAVRDGGCEILTTSPKGLF
ncbi:MAG: type I methionyl aminopeptidase [Proteobacteria bacterium]|nr:MAG: type I methionyl aminopeptidase [Pseudomonadota bacterium]